MELKHPLAAHTLLAIIVATSSFADDPPTSPPKPLIIQVKQGTQNHAHRRTMGVKHYQTNKRDRLAQQLRVLEGYPAHIQTGQSVPIIRQSYITTPSSTQPYAQLDYQDVSSGFYVVAKVVGKNVQLTISTQKETISNEGAGKIETQALATTMQAALGEWVEIGGGLTKKADSKKYNVYSTRTRKSEAQSVWIKVDVDQP